jgi:hypothetical protein
MIVLQGNKAILSKHKFTNSSEPTPCFIHHSLSFNVYGFVIVVGPVESVDNCRQPEELPYPAGVVGLAPPYLARNP